MNKLNKGDSPVKSGGEIPQRPAMTKAAPARGGMGARAYGGADPADSMPIGGGAKTTGYAYDQMEDAYDDGAVNVNTAPCRKCGRNFAEDRLAKHEKICKVNAKPKKVKMFHKPITEKEKEKMDAVKAKTSKWRDQHNDFVQAMKYNRKVSQVEKTGGDIRAMAPPPQSSNVGFTPCPYCGRKFGDVQAAKHIPVCKNTINKPKPPPARAGVGMGGSSAAYGNAPSKVSAGPSKVTTGATKSSGLGGGLSGQSYSRAAPGGPSGRTQGGTTGAGGMGGIGAAPGQNGTYRRKF